MKRELFVVILFATAAFQAFGQSQNRQNLRLGQELMKLQHEEDEAESKKDFPALDQLISDGFIFTAPNGTVTDKKQFYEEIRSDDSATDEAISYSEVRAYDYGKAAVVNYQLSVKGKDKAGQDYTNRYRNTVTWVKQGGRWRIASFHVSRIRP